MLSSGIWCRVGLVRTNVLQKCVSIFRVKGIREQGTALMVGLQTKPLDAKNKQTKNNNKYMRAEGRRLGYVRY
jgi:hypothetical protein